MKTSFRYLKWWMLPGAGQSLTLLESIGGPAQLLRSFILLKVSDTTITVKINNHDELCGCSRRDGYKELYKLNMNMKVTQLHLRAET